MYPILDTNVLVSALRSKNGASHKVLRSIFSGNIQIALSVAVVLEYEDVLSRPGILPTLSSANVRVVLDHLCSTATHQEVYFIWRPQLPDSGDDLFLELAIAAQAPYIITHNLNDFRGSKYFSVNAITPKQALQLI